MLTVLSLAALALGPAAPTPPAQAKAGLTATLTLDGKPVALRHVVAIQRPDVFNEKKEAYTLAFTADPIPAEALKGIASEDAFAAAVKQGVVLHVGQEDYCKIVIRDPALGGRELQNMGGFVCKEDSIKVFGPDHVQGGVVSGFQGKEEDIAGHKVKYDLRFDAPVVKRFFPR